MGFLIRRAAISKVSFASLLLSLLSVPVFAQSPDNGKPASSIPDLGVLWSKGEDEYFRAPKNGAGPPMSLPVIKGAQYEADYRNPVLKPWVADILRKAQEADFAGKAVASGAQSTCWPGGVPGADAPHYVLDVVQTPKLVVLLYNNNDQARFIYLNQPHSKNAPLSWYGESVGHYEGDTLVVDTIGLGAMNGKSVMDTFGTPHTDALHVIERYHVINGGKTLRIDIHVDDPGAFNMPFDMYADLDKNIPPSGLEITEHLGRGHDGSFEERVCADNNRSRGLVPMPIANKPDF